MYKVFFNGSSIQIGNAGKKSFKNNIVEAVECEHVEKIQHVISRIETSEENLFFYLLNENISELWNCFRRQFVEIPAAGGLVRKDDGSLLFIKRLGVWDLPKGKVEKHESAEVAAVREVEEECGLMGLEIVRQLRSTFHIYRSPYLNFPDNLVLKETKWFLMQCNDVQKLVPQVEENIEDVRWIARDEVGVILDNTYASLKEFLTENLPII
jgi:8-oxo-dGTP pyrophosphatase MutT (NUDIX family)